MSFFTEPSSATARRLLIQMAEETLQFEYQAGDVTPVTRPYTTGWRTFSALLVAYLHGTAELAVQGRKPKRLLSDRVHCVLPGVHHLIRITHRGAGFSSWSHVNFTICSTIQIVSLLTPPTSIAGKSARAICSINRELALLAQEKEPTLRQVFRRKMLAFQLLLLITEKATPRTGTFEYLRKVERLAPVLAYMKEHFTQPIEPATLATLAGLSPSRFHAVFQEALGQSPGRHLQGLRLQRASQLLFSPRTIGEVALASGYQDLFHFSRLFKKRFGVSPSAYRKQAKNRARSFG